MSKGRKLRTRSIPGSKIDQVQSTQPRASKVTSTSNEANSSSSMASKTVGDNSEILNEIRNMNQDLQQKIQKVGDDVTAIKDNLASLKSDVAKLGSRTSEAEGRISQMEDENTRLATLTQSMDNKIKQLEARVEYQENYSRRKNMRIKGVPEGAERGHNEMDCVKEVLRDLFTGTSENVDDMCVERAHRTPAAPNPQDRRFTGPRHILVRFLRFADREKVRLRAKELGTFQWKGARVEFFPDFTREVQNKRGKFTEVRRLCMKRGLQYSMQYPAVFWVTVDGKRHRFDDAAAAKRCVDNHNPAREAE